MLAIKLDYINILTKSYGNKIKLDQSTVIRKELAKQVVFKLKAISQHRKKNDGEHQCTITNPQVKFPEVL